MYWNKNEGVSNLWLVRMIERGPGFRDCGRLLVIRSFGLCLFLCFLRLL